MIIPEEFVVDIHDSVIEPHELQGLNHGASLESALNRIRTANDFGGGFQSVFHLASYYAEVIAVGHCFRDANKRTAFAIMSLVLESTGFSIENLHVSQEVIADQIVRIAKREIDHLGLAEFLVSEYSKVNFDLTRKLLEHRIVIQYGDE